MKTTAVDMQKYFEPLIGQQPKRARLGFGTFVTFDFGQRHLQNGKFHYAWQLWIQQCDWYLQRRASGTLLNSESNRSLLERGVRSLETKRLESVSHVADRAETKFMFSEDIVFACKAYNDSEGEDCWALYMPDRHVLLADSRGRLRCIRSAVPERRSNGGNTQHNGELASRTSGRKYRLE
jgi:hypothetical protein